jgi:acetyl-CoA carboxylase biotin carboxyl carrier protein
MDLNDIRQILDLVREHDLAELEIERDGLKVRVRKAGAVMSLAAPAVAPTLVAGPAQLAPAPAPSAPARAEEPEGMELAVIKSPIVGTFYRSSEPGAKAFVEVGDVVRKGQVLCIIEAMKLMNEIESDTEGEITAIYVENGRPVQFGDRLFAIRAASL